jgi:hypothetical protein
MRRVVPLRSAYLNAEVQALSVLACARARKQALRDAGITTEELDPARVNKFETGFARNY